MDRFTRPAALVLGLLATGCTAPPPSGPQPQSTQFEKLATDALLTTAVKAKLIAVDPDSTASLGVSVSDGVATLRGAVRSPHARTVTVAAARSVTGIRAVRDELRVDPNLPDAAIAARIATAILAQTGSTDVRVGVAGGIVTLSGTTGPKVREVALTTAHHTVGVRDVIDRIAVR
jgi:hyperosmotically inducible protein